MNDDYRARSPRRGRSPAPRGSRERGYDYEDRRDASYRSRQEYSRSPPDFYRRASPDATTRTRHEMAYRGADDNRYGTGHYGYQSGAQYSGYETQAPRGSRQTSRGAHDYEGMYDDPGSNSRDRHSRRSRSPANHHRSNRSTSSSRSNGPSDTVILEGLPTSVEASELRTMLLEDSVALPFLPIDVRVPHSYGRRSRAFVQFAEVDHAVAFLEKHTPVLHLTLQYSTDQVPSGQISLHPHYARARDDADHRPSPGPGDEWRCYACGIQNWTSRSSCRVCARDRPEGWDQQFTGVTDAAPESSQILVLYPLPAGVDEEMLAREIKRLEIEKPEPPKEPVAGAPKLKSTAPSNNIERFGARQNSIHRVFLMRNFYSGNALNYGFVEFWAMEDAKAAMAKYELLREFRILGCVVKVSGIHNGVFVPEVRELFTRRDDAMTFHPLSNPSLRVRYRDERAYPSQKIVTSEPPPAPEVSKVGGDEDKIGKKAESKKPKKRKADGSAASSVPKTSAALTDRLAKWTKSHNELHSDKADTSNDAVSGDNFQQPAFTPSYKKARPNPKTANMLSGLSSLKVPGSNAADAPSPPGETASEAPKDVQPQASAAPNDGAQQEAAQQKDAPADPFIEREKLTCWLCAMKYKSIEDVNIHQKSTNHKQAKADQVRVEAAVRKLAAKGKKVELPKPTMEEDPAGQYRDRAKERRDAFKQPKKPSGQPAQAKATVKPTEKGGNSATAAKPAQSKGAGMLAKMGWTGTGLGAHGEGRTEAIQTNAYQEGAGLGAEGANLGDAAQLAERKTKNDYAAYVKDTQDKARQRYNNIN